MRIETACQRSFLKIATDLGDANFQMQHIVFILQTALKGGGNDINGFRENEYECQRFLEP
jgi:hypothetical protein